MVMANTENMGNTVTGKNMDMDMDMVTNMRKTNR